jgi:hypothetical protein
MSREKFFSCRRSLRRGRVMTMSSATAAMAQAMAAVMLMAVSPPGQECILQDWFT